jgi:hypothetical protein
MLFSVLVAASVCGFGKPRDRQVVLRQVAIINYVNPF